MFDRVTYARCRCKARALSILCEESVYDLNTQSILKKSFLGYFYIVCISFRTVLCIAFYGIFIVSSIGKFGHSGPVSFT